jgi:hypothetical protein
MEVSERIKEVVFDEPSFDMMYVSSKFGRQLHIYQQKQNYTHRGSYTPP